MRASKGLVGCTEHVRKHAMRGPDRRWGFSAAVRLPAARLGLDATVKERVQTGRMVIGPIRDVKVALADLLARIVGENRHESIKAAAAK